jgi:multidrug efflux pump
MIASGAGAEMRRSLGTAVFSGMLGVTLFGIFLTPVFFYVILGVGEAKLFSGSATPKVIAYTMSGLLGGVTGFLLAKLHVGKLPWMPGIGAATGILIAVTAFELRKRVLKPATAVLGPSKEGLLSNGQGGAANGQTHDPSSGHHSEKQH